VGVMLKNFSILFYCCCYYVWCYRYYLANVI